MKTRCAVTALLAVAAVYLAVGPHEIGHATAAWLYGCKADAWRTGMRWYLAGSQGGAIDEVCLNRHGRWWLPARTPRGGVRWGLVASVLVALANGAEALSYLVVNTLWLKTDMEIVVAAAGAGRWPWTVAGLILGAVFARALAGPVRSVSAALAGPGIPERLWRWALTGYALAVSLAAVLSRMLLS